jgi:hypothetical protein
MLVLGTLTPYLNCGLHHTSSSSSCLCSFVNAQLSKLLRLNQDENRFCHSPSCPTDVLRVFSPCFVSLSPRCDRGNASVHRVSSSRHLWVSLMSRSSSPMMTKPRCLFDFHFKSTFLFEPVASDNGFDIPANSDEVALVLENASLTSEFISISLSWSD